MSGRRDSLAARLEEKSIPEPNSGCLLWLGAIGASGYPRLVWQNHDWLAHRLAWMEANGRPIPDGLLVCHKCDVPACINPDHLFLGTPADNMVDMVRKGRKKGGRKPPLSQVLGIREAAGSLSEIARRFGVSVTTVWEIKHGETKGHDI